VRICWRGFPN